MKPYRLKHKPSGLYWKPVSSSGHLSKRGKIYQTKINPLNEKYYSNGDERRYLTVFVPINGKIYKEFKYDFKWVESLQKKWVKCDTKVEDWEIEYI